MWSVDVNSDFKIVIDSASRHERLNLAAMRQNSAVLTRRARPWRPPSGGIHHVTETAVGCWVNNKGDGSPCAALCTASYGGLAALLGAFVEDGSSFAAVSP